MKKILSFVAVMLVLGTMSNAQTSADGDARATAVARAAIASDCLQGATTVQSSVSVNYDCNIFDGTGQNRTVYFYSAPNCPPNQICPLVRIAPLAKVVVDCNFNIESIECYQVVIF